MNMRHVCAVVFCLIFLTTMALAGEVNACKYLVVVDFTSDPFGIAEEFRAQGSAKGFTIVSAVSEIPQADLLKTCVMSGSWARSLGGGQISMRVVDTPGGVLLAEATTTATNWWTVKRTVRGAVSRIYSQLGYTGYSDDVNRQHILREYPPRPKFAITEDEIKKGEAHSPIEENLDRHRRPLSVGYRTCLGG